MVESTLLEDVMFHMEWDCILFCGKVENDIINAIMGDDRWIIGQYTGPDKDWICFAPAFSVEDSEFFLAPAGNCIRDALEKTLKEASDTHPCGEKRKHAMHYLELIR